MNPINYARGLLEEIDGCERSGDSERKALATTELRAAVDHLRAFDISPFADDVKALRDVALTDVEAFLAAPKRAARKPATK